MKVEETDMAGVFQSESPHSTLPVSSQSTPQRTVTGAPGSRTASGTTRTAAALTPSPFPSPSPFPALPLPSSLADEGGSAKSTTVVSSPAKSKPKAKTIQSSGKKPIATLPRKYGSGIGSGGPGGISAPLSMTLRPSSTPIKEAKRQTTTPNTQLHAKTSQVS